MTKRGQNRLVQITLHVHSHTIGGYEEGVNRLCAGLRWSRADSGRRPIAVNVTPFRSLAQNMGNFTRDTGRRAVLHADNGCREFLREMADYLGRHPLKDHAGLKIRRSSLEVPLGLCP